MLGTRARIDTTKSQGQPDPVRSAREQGWVLATVVATAACAGAQGGTPGGAGELGELDDSGTTGSTGTSGQSSAMGETMPETVELPGTPLSVTVEPGATQIVVAWSTADVGGAPEAYRVLLDDVEAHSVDAPAEVATLTNLEPATAYSVRVEAVNAAGSSAPSEAVRVVTDFSPMAFSGTRLWLDADDASTFTLVSGDRVSVWRDKSGLDNHAYQGIDALMPIRVPGVRNDRESVRFDDAYLTTSDVVQLRETDAGYTVFAVVMNTKGDGIEGNEGRGGVLLGNFGDDSPNVAIELHQDRQLRHWWDVRDEPGLPAAGNTGDVRFPSPTPAQSTYAILLFYRDGVAARFGGAVDGISATEVEDDGPNLTVSLPFRVGGDYRASPLPVSWNGDVAELIIFDRLLSVDERARIHEQLSFKWAIALS
jgi:hypothetical protein